VSLQINQLGFVLFVLKNGEQKKRPSMQLAARAGTRMIGNMDSLVC